MVTVLSYEILSERQGGKPGQIEKKMDRRMQPLLMSQTPIGVFREPRRQPPAVRTDTSCVIVDVSMGTAVFGYDLTFSRCWLNCLFLSFNSVFLSLICCSKASISCWYDANVSSCDSRESGLTPSPILDKVKMSPEMRRTSENRPPTKKKARKAFESNRVACERSGKHYE